MSRQTASSRDSAWRSRTQCPSRWPEVLAIPGFTGARRFKLPQTGDYLAIYEIDADDLAGPAAELRARSAAGRMHASDVLRTDPPPVVTLYQLIG